MTRYSPYIEFIKSLSRLENDSARCKETEKTLKLIDWFAHVVLNSLSAHICILDENGNIIQTNESWKAFAQLNNIGMRPRTIAEAPVWQLLRVVSAEFPSTIKQSEMISTS